MTDEQEHVPDPKGLAGAILDFNAWEFWQSASADQQRSQLGYQRKLADRNAQFADRCFVSELAACYPDELVMGERSYIAAFAYVTGSVRMGADTTVNAYTIVRGNIRLGDGVRIGAHSSLLGFNHSMEPDRPVFRQPVASKGITVGDDVWIGSNVVVVDGVAIGEHSVIGAGAVVTRDVPAWAVVAGNPARRLRDRRDPRAGSSAGPTAAQHGTLTARLEKFGQVVREQAVDVLARCWTTTDDEVRGWFVDRPGRPPTVRALCDAVEISDLLLGRAPAQLPAELIIDRLGNWQVQATGLVPQLTIDGKAVRPGQATLQDHDLGGGPVRYHILAAGHALELLGSSFPHPITAVHDITSDQLVATLESLPWTDRAWSAGDWIDCFATGLYWNRHLFGIRGTLDTLIGWLHTHVDAHTGMWGSPTVSEARRQMVNGYYRLTRGTFAQFGLPVPHPEQVIDTVLAHTRDTRWFGEDGGTACDVLDVIHPLWLTGAQTSYRRADVHSWAATQLDQVLRRWHPHAGFGFAPRPGNGLDAEPGLQGTEMWLAITWYLASVLGEAGALGYAPRGVHRPDARIARIPERAGDLNSQR
ncbi:acyltransferase [Phytoactinopolyspora endophytica]|uniref:acyltransferase n=1 Tax=Phytoactinopolyspora endophytica TaxID=1642495 RepID=UPI00197B31D6|nr:acyltransferase [Phytoactinopolyspora endophytica]